MSDRLTPPSIQDGPLGYEPNSISNFESPSMGESQDLNSVVAAKIGREIWDSSTNWLNSGRRSRWNDNLRAFQNMHPSGSKYLSGDYRFRSSLYRPKTRTMIRRDESATASALFANEDVVSIAAADDDDPKQQASAEIIKQLLQYRLANAEGADRIPWFQTVIGARQDADVMGICVAKVGWKYAERYVKSEMRPIISQKTGMPTWDDELKKAAMENVDIFEKTADHPFIDLIAPENIRFEPGCDWRNPVMSSPYLVELVPVYISEAMERMESQHGAPAEWLRVSPSALRSATDMDDDVTRRARETGRVPGKDHDAWKPRDFDIAWTRLNIIRWKGQDWYFRTLGSSGEILEPPRPLREVCLHGERPYVVGCVVLETHKTYPSSKVELTNDLQRAANQDWNSRFDAVMLGLQPRQFVREGAGQDINDLRTMMPGKVVMVSGVKGEPLTNQITWDRPPQVDGASFQEQDRINLDYDDLVGSFTASSQAASQITQPSATGMHLLSGEASGLNEYELRVFAETFVEPTLRLLVKTEQAYETDEVVLALAGKRANLFQRFGIDKITDELLQSGVTVKLNIGIGATNPQMKLKNFAMGAQILGQMFGQSAAMGANFPEVAKELFGLLGYKDGERFFKPDFDPRVHMLQQQLDKAKKSAGQPDQSKVQAAQITSQAKLQERQLQAQSDMQMAQMEYQTKKMAEDADNERVRMKVASDQQKQQGAFTHDHEMAAHKFENDSMSSDQKSSNEQRSAFAKHGMNQDISSQQHDQNSQMAIQQHLQNLHAAQQELHYGQQNAVLAHDHDQQLANQSFVHGLHSAQQGHAHSQEMATQQHSQARETQHHETESKKSQEVRPAQMMHVLGMAQEQSAETAKQITEAVSKLAEVVQNGNTQIAQIIAQSAKQSNDANVKLAQVIQATTSKNDSANNAILAALTRKKTVVRNKDGKIEGVE